ncbi:uncharacterized protein LOC131943493 [Physella acuta]|uniref:uncharacterized protein LOC131943493 n=1 Tax=Physella acuta TaxID=109671 RepID=UPI0027DCD087|nr:uncharacterized protein LOC131943493 [Physella acuta]
MTQGLGQYAREPMARLLVTLMTFQMMPVSSRNCASMNGLTLGRTCYILVGLERDWASALQTCIKHGMQPVMISDVIQLGQVVDFLKNKSNSGVWTGGKSLPDMTFVWDVNNIPVNLELVHDVTNTTREANYCLALTLNSTLVKRPCEQQLDVLCMKDDLLAQTVLDLLAQTVLDLLAQTVSDLLAQTCWPRPVGPDCTRPVGPDLLAQTVLDLLAQTYLLAQTVLDLLAQTCWPRPVGPDLLAQTVLDLLAQTVLDLFARPVGPDCIRPVGPDLLAQTVLDLLARPVGPDCIRPVGPDLLAQTVLDLLARPVGPDLLAQTVLDFLARPIGPDCTRPVGPDLLAQTVLDLLARPVGSDYPVWLGEKVVCRCKRGQCNSSGECIATTCQAGWFGPACQIKDHVHEGTFVPRELMDDNVTTCIQTNYLKVQFGDVKFIAWVSLVHNNKDSLHDLTMTLSNDLETSYNCTELRLLNVEETVVDVRCGRGIHYVQRVELRWSTNKTLCSLHVAGGVNSALRQKTEMSRTGGVELSHYSVDGETGLGAECARTQEEDPTAYWKLTFDKPRLVYEIIVHRASRRHDWSFMDGFLLESYDVSGRTVHTARGVGHTTHLQAHIHTCSTAPVLTIVMNVMGLHNSLEICEFETYGDCAPPYYGYGCASECNQLCLDRKCHYNGFCYDCELGKSGDYCETDPRSNPTQPLSSYFWDIVTLLGYLVTFGLVMWLLFYLSQRYSKKRARRRLSRRMSTGRKPQTPPKPPIEPHPDESGLSLGKTESKATEMTSATTSTQSSEGTGTSA